MSGSGCSSSFVSTPASRKPPDRVRGPGRPRPGSPARLLRDQPRLRERGSGCGVRQSAERLLAAAGRGRIHTAAPRAARAVRSPGLRDRAHERGSPDDPRLQRPAGGGLRRRPRAHRDDRAGARAACHRVRRKGRLPGHVPRAPGTRAPGPHARGDAALRPAVDVTSECRRPVGRAASLVSGAEEARLDALDVRAEDVTPPVGVVVPLCRRVLGDVFPAAMLELDAGPVLLGEELDLDLGPDDAR